MLASLLFPYDDDAKNLINAWLSELSDERCIIRYSIDGDSYIQITKWLNHQKIDKPTKSKIPQFDDNSIILANPRESSCEDLDLGSGPKDLGMDQGSTDTLVADAIAPTTPDCPHQEILDLYHEILPTLSQVRLFTDQRKKQLRARWRENTKHQSLDFWRKYFDHVSRSDFLMGRSPPTNGRTWQADFDFLTTASKFVCVLEGKYHA